MIEYKKIKFKSKSFFATVFTPLDYLSDFIIFFIIFDSKFFNFENLTPNKTINFCFIILMCLFGCYSLNCKNNKGKK
jgi:hypothetical protein